MLTEPTGSAKKGEQQRHDRNREIKLLAIKKLQQLLEVAGHEAFSGHILLEINSGSGHLGKVKSQVTEYSGP